MERVRISQENASMRHGRIISAGKILRLKAGQRG
jgi:hypothetical protein